MSDRDPADSMIHDLGLDPALDVDSDQRAELLQRWHQDDSERTAERDDTADDGGKHPPR